MSGRGEASPSAKSGGSKGAGNSAAQSNEAAVFGGMTKSQIQSKIMEYAPSSDVPELTGGSQAIIAQGEQAREEIAGEMWEYALGFGVQKSPFNYYMPDYSIDFLYGADDGNYAVNKTRIADNLVNLATQKSRGYDKMFSGKTLEKNQANELNKLISDQNKLVGRVKRSEAPFTKISDANAWIKISKDKALRSKYKDYIDGKIDKFDI